MPLIIGTSEGYPHFWEAPKFLATGTQLVPEFAYVAGVSKASQQDPTWRVAGTKCGGSYWDNGKENGNYYLGFSVYGGDTWFALSS